MARKTGAVVHESLRAFRGRRQETALAVSVCSNIFKLTFLKVRIPLSNGPAYSLKGGRLHNRWLLSIGGKACRSIERNETKRGDLRQLFRANPSKREMGKQNRLPTDPAANSLEPVGGTCSLSTIGIPCYCSTGWLGALLSRWRAKCVECSTNFNGNLID